MYYTANIENVWIWVAIAVVLLIVFGGSKIPEMMKGIGQGVRELKKGMNEPDEEKGPGVTR
jgi:sec-independent protein translocase protein TatA